jgi:hypothetical protein
MYIILDAAHERIVLTVGRADYYPSLYEEIYAEKEQHAYRYHKYAALHAEVPE